MKRIVLVVTAGALLLTGAACGSTTDTDAGTAAAAPTATTASAVPVAASPSADYAADTKKTCDQVLSVLGGEKMKSFGEKLGEQIAYTTAKQSASAKKARTAAGVKLKDAAVALNGVTAKAQDPEVKAAGKEIQKRMNASAEDDAFFAKFKTVKDVDKVLETQMESWMEPLNASCA
jgi:hypothetical protein